MNIYMGTNVFDISLPLSSILVVMAESAAIYYAVMLADVIITHRIESGRIRAMSIASYLVSPVIISLITEMFPIFLFKTDYAEMLSFVAPLAVWMILGEIFIRDLTAWKKLFIASLGYAIFLLFNFTGILSIMGSILRF